MGVFKWPLLPAAKLFICSIDHFGFLAQFVGICPIGQLPYFIGRIFPPFPLPVWKGHADAALTTLCATQELFLGL